MAIELKVPEVGESITEAMIGEWLKSEGDSVEQDEPLVVIETDKVTVELPSPAAGVLQKIVKEEGDEAEVGEVIGYLEPSAEMGETEEGEADKKDEAEKEDKAEKDKAKKDKAEKDKAEKDKAKKDKAEKDKAEKEGKADKKGGPEPQDKTDKEEPKEDRAAEETDDEESGSEEPRVMPAARRLLEEAGLDASRIEATGPGGRLLKEDVLRYLAAKKGGAEATKPQPAPTPEREAEIPKALGSREEEAVKMTPLRRRVAERLVQAQQDAALLTTFNEIDMSRVMALRKQYQERFVEKNGIKLGFMSFFVKAVVEALKESPRINAEIRGNEIVYRNYYDIGVAIGGGRGLVVPVIRNAERLSFAEVEKTIAEYAKRARENKLKLEELQGGTFTISNGGIYGSLLSTPIVNPPQSGILGMHAIQERPVAQGGEVVVRPMMYVALTYDHRIVDGREAVTFLVRVKERVEDPTRILLEV